MSSKNKKSKKKKNQKHTANKKKKNGKSLKPKPKATPKHKKVTSAPRVKKQSKLKFKKFEKCPGYASIIKAQNCEQEKKYTAAIRHYTIGCDSLQEYTKQNVDNALEKRNRMERIQEYRQRMLKLQNAALVKKALKPKKEEKAQTIPFNQEEGYKIVQQAINAKNNDKLEKAVQLYEKGLTMLEQELFEITDSKEKKMRTEKINEWRSEQQWCRNQLEGRKLKNNKLDKTKMKKKSAVHLRSEPGYQYCRQAEDYEREKNYDVAIQYYEKGIPLLEDKMIYGTDSSSQKRERAKHIESYRHSLQSLKNRKIRRKSTKFKATKVPESLRDAMAKQRDISGGVLYKNIREGTLSVGVIKHSNRLSMFHMLPIVASSCIHAPLPFRSFIGDNLLEAMNSKIEISGSLEQRLRCFLCSYYEQDIVQELWGDHPAMPTITDLSDMGDGSGGGDEKEDIDDEQKTSFEDTYVEKDAISFFRKVADSNYPEVGQEIAINSKYMDIYDLMGTDKKINKIRIEKIFKSKTKPLLLTTYHKISSDKKYKEISRFIVKKGDDLRLDSGAMHMFRFFNSIWSEEGLEYNGYAIQCLLYSVVAMGNDFGAIEFIPNCKPLRHVYAYFHKFGYNELCNLVASAAGSYIASFVLGVRDRHFDNVLIQKDGTLFHIDFGYVMGAKLMMDTSKIAITNDLCKLFNNHWENFIDIATNAFMTLRLHYQDILDYSHLVFDFVNLDSNPSEFLYKMLKMHQTDKIAEEIIRNKLASAPSSFHTKLKNAAHYVATL